MHNLNSLKLAVILIVFASISTGHAVALKAMDIEPGLWKSKTEMGGGFIEQALAQIPEAQRAMVKEMMKSKMEAQNPVTDICFTKEMINNPQKAYEEQMTKSNGDCKVVVEESTSTKFIGNVKCKNKALSSRFTWKVINKKKTETLVNAVGPGGVKQDIKVISTWVEAKCTPKKL